MSKKLSFICLIVVLVLGIIATSNIAIRYAAAKDSGDTEADEEIVTAAEKKIESKDVKLKIGEDKKKKVRITGIEQKQFTGELISLYPRGNPKFIALTDPKGDVDYAFEIDGNAQIQGVRSLSDLQIGDTVTVMCNEIQKVRGEGTEEEERGRDRKAAIIKFVSRKRAGSLVSQ